MATFISFWAGFGIFITCCALAFIMSYSGGKVIDVIHEQALETGMLKPDATANDYQKGSEGTLYLMINSYYFIMYVLPVFGAVIFGQSILVRLREEVWM